jgi:hypothetical protein
VLPNGNRRPDRAASEQEHCLAEQVRARASERLRSAEAVDDFEEGAEDGADLVVARTRGVRPKRPATARDGPDPLENRGEPHEARRDRPLGCRQDRPMPKQLD